MADCPLSIDIRHPLLLKANDQKRLTNGSMTTIDMIEESDMVDPADPIG